VVDFRSGHTKVSLAHSASPAAEFRYSEIVIRL